MAAPQKSAGDYFFSENYDLYFVYDVVVNLNTLQLQRVVIVLFYFCKINRVRIDNDLE